MLGRAKRRLQREEETSGGVEMGDGEYGTYSTCIGTVAKSEEKGCCGCSRARAEVTGRGVRR